MAGFIYILTNQSFPKFCKTGYSSDVSKTVRKLNASGGTPFDYVIYATYELPEGITEDEANSAFATLIMEEPKEGFYEIKAKTLYTVLDAVARLAGREDKLKLYNGLQIPDVPKNRTEIKRQYLPRTEILFNNRIINVGDEVYLINKPSEKATVVDGKHVSYKGKKMSFNQFGKLISGSETICIYNYLMIAREGKLLGELRRDMMNEANAPDEIHEENELELPTSDEGTAIERTPNNDCGKDSSNLTFVKCGELSAFIKAIGKKEFANRFVYFSVGNEKINFKDYNEKWSLVYARIIAQAVDDSYDRIKERIGHSLGKTPDGRPDLEKNENAVNDNTNSWNDVGHGLAVNCSRDNVFKCRMLDWLANESYFKDDVILAFSN